MTREIFISFGRVYSEEEVRQQLAEKSDVSRKVKIVMNLVTSIDPRFFENERGRQILCELCGLRLTEHDHHAIFKKMGGRKGAAKIAIERPENHHDVCLVCHDAIHIRHAIQNGFCCDVCPNLPHCFYGSRLLKKPYEHLTPPF